MFEPWELALIEQAGYNGIRDSHIAAVAQELMKIGQKDIDRLTFHKACHACGVDPRNFTSQDLRTLEDYLNK